MKTPPDKDCHLLKQSLNKAFSLVEIIVVIAVVAVLAVLIFSMSQSLVASSASAKCIANLRAIANGFAMFLAENNNQYPGNGPRPTADDPVPNRNSFRYMHRIGAYMDLGKVTSQTAMGETVNVFNDGYYHPIFYCPLTAPSKYQNSMSGIGLYGANMNIVSFKEAKSNMYGISAGEIRSPARTVLLAERNAGLVNASLDPNGPTLDAKGPFPANRNGAAANHRKDKNPAADSKGAGPCNMLFVDGHVETVFLEKLRPWPTTYEGSRITFVP